MTTHAIAGAGDGARRARRRGGDGRARRRATRAPRAPPSPRRVSESAPGAAQAWAAALGLDGAGLLRRGRPGPALAAGADRPARAGSSRPAPPQRRGLRPGARRGRLRGLRARRADDHRGRRGQRRGRGPAGRRRRAAALAGHGAGDAAPRGRRPRPGCRGPGRSGAGGRRGHGGRAAEAAPAEQEPPAKTLEELLAELDGLTGLEAVKREVHRQAQLLRVEQLRAAAGLRSPAITRHLVFLGNPGTGKTTVGRLVAGIYRALGLLSKGQLVEVDRSELVAGYLGQTAIKTQEVVGTRHRRRAVHRRGVQPGRRPVRRGGRRHPRQGDGGPPRRPRRRRRRLPGADGPASSRRTPGCRAGSARRSPSRDYTDDELVADPRAARHGRRLRARRPRSSTGSARSSPPRRAARASGTDGSRGTSWKQRSDATPGACGTSPSRPWSSCASCCPRIWTRTRRTTRPGRPASSEARRRPTGADGAAAPATWLRRQVGGRGSVSQTVVRPPGGRRPDRRCAPPVPPTPAPAPPRPVGAGAGAAAPARSRAPRAGSAPPRSAGVLVCLVFAALGGNAFRARGAALDQATQAAAQLVRVQQVAIDVARADALVTNAFLQGARRARGHGAASTRPRSTRPARASPRPRRPSPATPRRSARSNSALTRYTAAVAAARANNRQGFQVGSGYLRQASNLLRTPTTEPGRGAPDPASRGGRRRARGSTTPSTRPATPLIELFAAGLVVLAGLLGRPAVAGPAHPAHPQHPDHRGAASPSSSCFVDRRWSCSSPGQSAANRVRDTHYAATQALSQARIDAFDAQGERGADARLPGQRRGLREGLPGPAGHGAARTSTRRRPPAPRTRAAPSWTPGDTAHKQVRKLDDEGEWTARRRAGDRAARRQGLHRVRRRRARAALQNEAAAVATGLQDRHWLLVLLGWVTLIAGLVAAGAAGVGIAQRLGEYR